MVYKYDDYFHRILYLTKLETSSFFNFGDIFLNDGMVDGNVDENRVRQKCDE